MYNPYESLGLSRDATQLEAIEAIRHKLDELSPTDTARRTELTTLLSIFTDEHARAELDQALAAGTLDATTLKAITDRSLSSSATLTADDWGQAPSSNTTNYWSTAASGDSDRWSTAQPATPPGGFASVSAPGNASNGSAAADVTTTTAATPAKTATSSAAKWIIPLLVVLVIVLAGALVTFFVRGNHSDFEPTARSTTTSTKVVEQRTTTKTVTATPRTSVVSTFSAPSYSRYTPSTTSTANQPTYPPRLSPPSSDLSCGTAAGFTAYHLTEITSCPFSLATGREVADRVAGRRIPVGDTFTVEVYSTVTEKTYSMTCKSLGNFDFRCSGGNNAVVFLRSL
ncbi:hypothetical protein ACFPVT_09970 [Corynebacterium choanae]|uniref:Uncharacterized protein n=1 Tax=Corynebacterium choanae TaxID=1862358 RepID=A0A3G6J8S3_9CORY|nr:hypothetical protein [Corynebacterium choanae]AZA14173.1 hypothetical protein CCHOA_08950 [Corynebacterium choanae]